MGQAMLLIHRVEASEDASHHHPLSSRDAHGYKLEIFVPPLGSLHLKIAPGYVLVSTPKFQSACEKHQYRYHNTAT